MKPLTLAVLANTHLVCLDSALQVWIHFGYGLASRLRFELAEILRSEKELAVEVALLDGVKVGDMNDTLTLSTESHHRPILEHLAADSTRTDQELSVILDLLLECSAKHCDLTIVARPKGCTLGLGQSRLRVGR